MPPMLDTAVVLVVIAGLLIVVGFSQALAARLKLPLPVLLGAIGVAIGGFAPLVSAFGWSGPAEAVARSLASLPVSPNALLYVFLPLLVFEAGIATDLRRMIEDAAPILLLAVVATLVASGVVGLALWPIAGVPFLVCLLLGAVVATTDPVAVIAIFRDVGAPARLTRLVEGEALLNDAAAIALFVVVLDLIASARRPDIAWGLGQFALSFVGGGLFGLLAARALMVAIPWLRDDRLAEATLTVALAYLVYLAADRLLGVSGVVAVLGAGLAVSAVGRSRITPYNWSFLADLWSQIAFWARSLIFILAAILVPQLLGGLGLRDLALLAVLIAAAFAARILVLFLMMPPLEFFRLSQPISAAYKLAMTWGGLRGALTLVLALAATQNSVLGPGSQRFVGVLATGFVLFTLFVNGTTLRLLIKALGLDRLSPRNQVLRDRVLALSYAEVEDSVRETAERHAFADTAVEEVVAPYQAWIAAANARDAGERLSERDRLAVALVALANQERVLILEGRAGRFASPPTVQILLQNADALVDGARGEGRVGYRRAAEKALGFPVSFRLAYLLYRRLGIVRFLADALADRVELLLAMRLLANRLAAFSQERLASIFGARIGEIVREIVERRREGIGLAFDALRRQYPDYVAALETRFLRQVALRQEMGRYQALYEEGLIPLELYENLRRSVEGAHAAEPRPRFDIGLDTYRLIERLDMLSGLDEGQIARIAKLLRPRFTVPGEHIVKRGERGGAVYFIASGAVEVVRGARRIRLGSGEFFGEMALLSGRVRQADVIALTYCRLLELRRADFERFRTENPEAREQIDQVVAARLKMNEADDASLTRETAEL
jgi:CPA1 family monovalent cation:H+ antiporter